MDERIERILCEISFIKRKIEHAELFTSDALKRLDELKAIIKDLTKECFCDCHTPIYIPAGIYTVEKDGKLTPKPEGQCKHQWTLGKDSLGKEFCIHCGEFKPEGQCTTLEIKTKEAIEFFDRIGIPHQKEQRLTDLQCKHLSTLLLVANRFINPEPEGQCEHGTNWKYLCKECQKSPCTHKHPDGRDAWKKKSVLANFNWGEYCEICGEEKK